MSISQIVITGAGSGLGQAFAFALAKSDRHLHLVDINQQGLDSTLAQLPPETKCTLHLLDLSQLKPLEEWATELCRQLEIDMLINCAGVAITSDGLQVSMSQWTQVLEVNLLSTIQLCRTIGQQMRMRQTGTIINIASMFGLLPAPSGIAYATSKHALVGYTRTLRIELESDHVQVHLVCPGFLASNLFDNATYNNVDGQTLTPDTSQMMSVTEAASRTLKGVSKGKATIIFPWYVRILLWIEWFFPTLAHQIWRQQWKKFQQAELKSMPTDSDPSPHAVESDA